MRRLVVIVAVAVVLAACAVPHKKGGFALEKRAVEEFGLARAIDRYETLRAASFTILDAEPLATIERGALLDIDTGRIELARSLDDVPRAGVGALVLEEHFAPLVDSYPMWFLALVRDTGTKLVKVQVYERVRAAQEWLLMASPEIIPSTRLPALRKGAGDGLVQLDAERTGGLIDTPAAVVDMYVSALQDPTTKAAERIHTDGFRSQMNASRTEAESIVGVDYAFAWQAKQVRYAVRTDDGGALVFATLERADTYRIGSGRAIAWPAGSAEKAFLGDAVSGTSTVTYNYQILMYVPPEGAGKPFVLGQYGGVVDASNEDL